MSCRGAVDLGLQEIGGDPGRYSNHQLELTGEIMMLHKSVPMFSYAKEDDFAPGAPLRRNSNVPEPAYPLLRLWCEFGLRELAVRT